MHRAQYLHLSSSHYQVPGVLLSYPISCFLHASMCTAIALFLSARIDVYRLCSAPFCKHVCVSPLLCSFLQASMCTAIALFLSASIDVYCLCSVPFCKHVCVSPLFLSAPIDVPPLLCSFLRASMCTAFALFFFARIDVYRLCCFLQVSSTIPLRRICWHA